MKKTNKKGFTLIELLAVIVILAIIIVMAVASVGAVLNRMKKNAYVVEANTIVKALKNKAVTDTSILPTEEDGEVSIPLSDIELQNGTKSPYGSAYDESSYVKIKKLSGVGVYEYSICIVDAKGKGISETNIDEVIRNSVTTGVECSIEPETGLNGNDANTLLLLHAEDFNNSSSTANTISNTNVTISADQKKFGNSSFYFNGSSAFLNITNANLPAGNSTFTVDMWVYFTSNGTGQTILGIGTSGSNSSPTNGGVLFLSAGKLGYYATGNKIVQQVNPSLNTWHHIAFVYDGTITKIYIDGFSLTSTFTYTFSDMQWKTRAYIGANSCFVNGFEFFNGYIDEIRVSNIARWTENFTPPTQEYS